MLTIRNVNAHYGGVQALYDISFKEAAGEIVALIGANGAGKSTLLNLISGIIRPSSGEILFDGKDLSSFAPEAIVALGIVQVPENRLLFGPLTVKENLELGAYRLRRKKAKANLAKDVGYVMQLFPALNDRLQQRAQTLSGGEQQMLAIGRGLMANPRLLLLDEPSLGLAPLIVQEIMAVIKRLQEEGTTILLVEQNARAALKIADRAYVMETGRIRLAGRAAELLDNENVKKAYIG